MKPIGLLRNFIPCDIFIFEGDDPMDLHRTEHEIEIRGNEGFIGIGIVALFMAGIGVRLIVGMLPFEDGYTFGDVFGFVFLCLWTAVALLMGLFGISAGRSMLRVDYEGVTYRSMLRKQHLAWSEIADYGLSYCGQSRGDGNTYDFYFSTELQQAKNECSKNLKGQMIRYTVTEDDYSHIVEKVIPFCRARTRVEPFIGVDKVHFI
jgi:hypothetical protein